MEYGSLLGGILRSGIYICFFANLTVHTFFDQLYLFAHPKLLRPLQGICVPYIVGVYNGPEGHMSIAMETPHPTGWRTASPDIPQSQKEVIIEAYRKIHTQGIEHRLVSYENMLIGIMRAFLTCPFEY